MEVQCKTQLSNMISFPVLAAAGEWLAELANQVLLLSL